MSKEQQYPLFMGEGKSIYDYLYFRRNRSDENERLLVYTDITCMAEVYNLNMELSERVTKRGFI